MGPAAPLIALLTGALLGGVAGGTAGGVYTCKVEGDHYVIQYQAPAKDPYYQPVAGYNHHVHPLPYHDSENYNIPPHYRYNSEKRSLLFPLFENKI